jgi:putative tryptophan/tyrosine transport system substrate-binding protein
MPQIERVALVWDPNIGPDQRDAATAAARAMGIEALVLEIASPEGYEEAFRSIGNERWTGIVQLGSPTLSAFPARLAHAALKYRIPTISFWPPHANAGALMSYGPNARIYFQRAAVLADQILKGAKPGDLPFEQPMQYSLAINRATARAIGIEIPRATLLRADLLVD